LTDNSLQSADKDQQEMRPVAEKPHDAVVKFVTYQNLHRHRAVLPAIARHLVIMPATVNILGIFEPDKNSHASCHMLVMPRLVSDAFIAHWQRVNICAER